jgi:hypothetical protein
LAQQRTEDMYFIHSTVTALKILSCTGSTDSSLVNAVEDTIGRLEMYVTF